MFTEHIIWGWRSGVVWLYISLFQKTTAKSKSSFLHLSLHSSLPDMTTLEEKQYPALHDEKASSTESVELFTGKEARRIRRRIDYRLIPCLGL